MWEKERWKHYESVLCDTDFIFAFFFYPLLVLHQKKKKKVKSFNILL